MKAQKTRTLLFLYNVYFVWKNVNLNLTGQFNEHIGPLMTGSICLGTEPPTGPGPLAPEMKNHGLMSYCFHSTLGLTEPILYCHELRNTTSKNALYKCEPSCTRLGYPQCLTLSLFCSVTKKQALGCRE